MKPLAVTGLGVVSPVASNRAELFDALRDPAASAKKAFGLPSLFDGVQYGGACVSEIRNFDPTPVLGDKGLRNLDRLTKLFLVAGRRALEESGIKQGAQYAHYAGNRVGVCASTAYGSLEAMMELNRVAVLENPRYLNPSKFPNTVINSALGYLSIWDDLRALNATVCNGNCGALDAVLCADTYFAAGRANAILVGGGEAMHEGLYLAFDRLESLVTDSRKFAPGDPASQGMRLGEGAVLAVLEPDLDAKARGANAIAHVRGYGTSFEPPESEALLVHVDADSIARAIDAALADAGMKPSDVQVVASSANGIPRFDSAEAEALRRALGENVTVATPKVVFGETLGASGAFGLAAAIAWLQGVPVSPVIRGQANGTPESVLVTTVGFYGNASAIVVTR